MPRARWSGVISFGLVNVPVRMDPAISGKKTKWQARKPPKRRQAA